MLIFPKSLLRFSSCFAPVAVFLSILTALEMRFHCLPPVTSSFLGLLASRSATEPFSLLGVLQGASSVLLHMTFSIIHVSS